MLDSSSFSFFNTLSPSFSILLSSKFIFPVALTTTAYVFYSLYNYGSRSKDLPPGPPTVPVLGNIPVMPRRFLHLQFSEWAKQYGDIFSLKVFNQTIIVLNSPSAIKEVIDKHQSATSNRPASKLADMITPDNLNLGTGRHADETWRVLRKAATQLLSNESMKRNRNYQAAEATQLMADFLRDPEHWYSNIQRFVTSFTLGVVYGKRSPTRTSPDFVDFLDSQFKYIHVLEIGTAPPVDLFPILMYVPERWAGWKTLVRTVRTLHEALYERLLKAVETRMESGLGSGVFMEEAVRKASEWGLVRRDYLTNLGGVMIEGSDTSSAALQVVILALVAFPEAQKKAHEEIDRVVGTHRLPTFEDLPNLPYTMAFLEECHRWRPVSPLGLPHAMVHDEIIDGVLYPKDAVIFLNTWRIFHDERYFDRPDDFIPERFLKHPHGVKEGVEDDPARRANLLFGSGRRVCPGILFARSSMEMCMANFVWGFDFLPDVDPDSGKEIPPDLYNFAPGITAHPRPFRCRIQPRSSHHKEMVEKQFAQAAEFLSPYELEISAEEKQFNSTYRDNL